MQNRFNIILLELVVILLLLLFGEFFYFTYYLSDKNLTDRVDLPTNNQLMVKTPSLTSIPKETIDKLPPHKINPAALSFLVSLRKDLLQSASVSYIVKGSIVGIEKKPGMFEDGTMFERKFTMKGSQGSLLMQFVTERDMKKIEVVEKKGETIKQIKFDDLNISDNISVEQVSDPTTYINDSTSNFARLLITRIK